MNSQPTYRTKTKAIRGIEPGDRITVDGKEATFLGEWSGWAYYTLAHEEPRSRKMFEGLFREQTTRGNIGT